MATKYQTFDTRTICRVFVKNAPYNPRTISDDARARLKRKIRKSGLVEPPIWNETTGNLVGGHQRISILDELEGRIDYDLTVSAVKLDEKAEKALNVFLNNQSAMGDWDQDKLHSLIEELKDDGIESLGFDEASLEVVFDDKDLGGLFSDEKEGAKTDVETIKEMKELRKEHKEGSDEMESGDHYAVLVFADKAERDAFLVWRGLQAGTRFVRVEEMKKAMEGL